MLQSKPPHIVMYIKFLALTVTLQVNSTLTKVNILTTLNFWNGLQIKAEENFNVDKFSPIEEHLFIERDGLRA